MRWILMGGMFVAGCGDSPLETPHSRGGAWPSSPEDGDLVSEFGWMFTGGVCVIDATIPPTCPEVHLGPEPPAGERPCEAWTDCEDAEFCGNGYCRSHAEGVTVCVNELWVDAPNGNGGAEPPVLQAMLSTFPEYDGDHRMLVSVEPQRTCRLSAQQCTHFDVLEFTSAGRLEIASSWADECGREDRELDQSVLHGVGLLEHINEGCVAVPAGDTNEMHGWVSVWYP